MDTKTIVGIDVSRRTLDIAVMTNGNEDPKYLGQVANTQQGFKELTKKLKGYKSIPIILVVEPTGGYEQELAHFAIHQQWQVAMPNPANVRQWIKGQGQRGKTDKIDAKQLAEYGWRTKKLLLWTPLPEEVQLLDDLLKRREELQEALQQENNRLHSFELKPLRNPDVQSSLDRSIDWLKEEIEKLDSSIKSLVSCHSSLQEKAKLLKKNPGIGEKNCLYLVVHLYRWQSLTDGKGSSKGLTAYTGVDPEPCQSGTSLRKHEYISRKGNSSLRARLYMSALGGVRGNNPLKEYYQRLVKRGKAKKLALVACSRKVLTWAWAVFNTDTPFNKKLASGK